MAGRPFWFCAAVFAGFPIAAIAQSPSDATPITRYDGTYAFVSATHVNETYAITGTNRIRKCSDRGVAHPIIIVNGQARRYRKDGALLAEGTVGTQGELVMRFIPRPDVAFAAGYERTLSGGMDGNGTVRAREIGYNCNFDMIWQKVSK